MDKTPTHALFYSTLYYSSVLISLKYIKIFNGTPTCFDLKRSSSGVCLYLAKVTELFKIFEEFFIFKTLNLKSRWLNPVLWQQHCNEFKMCFNEMYFNEINTLD